MSPGESNKLVELSHLFDAPELTCPGHKAGVFCQFI